MQTTTRFSLTTPWVVVWILAPLLAYLLSVAGGLVIMLFFPPLLAVAQWLSIRLHPAEGIRRWQWLLVVGVGYVVGMFLLQVTGDSLLKSPPDGGQNGYAWRVFLYYTGQAIVGSLGLVAIFGQARWGFWLTGNLLAGIAWRFIFMLFNLGPTASATHYQGDAHTFALIPVAALFTNLITAYSLHLSLPQTSGDES
jgi:hypothetical protein